MSSPWVGVSRGYDLCEGRKPTILRNERHLPHRPSGIGPRLEDHLAQTLQLTGLVRDQVSRSPIHLETSRGFLEGVLKMPREDAEHDALGKAVGVQAISLRVHGTRIQLVHFEPKARGCVASARSGCHSPG